MSRSRLLIMIALAGCGHTTHDGAVAGADAGSGTQMPRPGPPGPPGCGLDAAAFCDTFDAPAGNSGHEREGELDPTKWSVWRTEQAALGGDSTTFGSNAI